jgi:GWxTD domain-containing protein
MSNTPRQILWLAGLFAAGCQILVMPSFRAYAAIDLQSVLLEQSSDAFLKQWLTQEVAYIASEAEKAAYLNLASDQARYEFIERFWQQRDPSPGTIENEFRDEHFRRIAYANARFSTADPGWKCDRGRIYITWGPPDQIESHPSGDSRSGPYEIWRYRAGSAPKATSERTLEFAGPDYKLREK